MEDLALRMGSSLRTPDKEGWGHKMDGGKRRGRGREKDGVKKPQSCMRLPMWAESGLSHGHFGEKHLSDWKCVW